MSTCYTVSISEMADKEAKHATVNPAQFECRLVRLVTPDGKRHAITATSYEGFAAGGKHVNIVHSLLFREADFLAKMFPF